MAGKNGKKGKKKKTKAPKRIPGTGEFPDAMVKRLLRTYENNCAESNTMICPDMRKVMKSCAENMALFAKAIIQSIPLPPAEPALPGEDPPPPIKPVALEPLLDALRKERYVWLKALYVWEVPLHYQAVASLANLLERQVYRLTLIELSDCLLDVEATERLARALNECSSLVSINLDYNEFGDKGCSYVCSGMESNTFILSISMCYCGLTSESGEYLGNTIATTALRELYLDGNDLECSGARLLIAACCDQAQQEEYDRIAEKAAKEEAEAMAREQAGTARPISAISAVSSEKKGKKGKKKKGKKKKKAKKPPEPPRVGRWLHKLHLADNGIDGFSAGGLYSPVIAMRTFRQLIAYSNCLEEIDLEDNLIGDVGGRELLEGLKTREECKLPSMKIRTTHRMHSDTFQMLVKMGGGLAKKKKKKGKKKKK